MNLIVAVSRDWGIGYKNKLMFRIAEDQRYFKLTTIGKIVVMGHNTFKSLPGMKPLVDRTNIVLSRDENLKIPGVTVVNSIEACLALLAQSPPEDVYIIGGSTIYQAFLPHCTTALVTKIDAVRSSDSFFPNLDQNPHWKLAKESEVKEEKGVEYKFCLYEKRPSVSGY